MPPVPDPSSGCIIGLEEEAWGIGTNNAKPLAARVSRVPATVKLVCEVAY